MQILALADDLTGALEIGAKFAARGIRSRVTLGRRLDFGRALGLLVINTETRHVPPEQAYARVRTLARAARRRGIRRLYKKTDSTLRGHIGWELAALLAAHPRGHVIYAPAYPALGRAVRQGRLYVNGVPVEETEFARDPLNPIHASDIPRVLAAQGAVPVFADSGELAERLAPGIYVCDGESTADVDRVAERLARQPSGWLAAGPAALAEAIAERLRPGAVARPAWPVVRTCLIVNGSLHPVSLAQVRYAAERGCAGGSGWDLLPLPEAAGLSGQAYAARLGEAVRAAIQARLPDALVIFGGDTAAAILRALGCTALRPVGELLPGVPLARLERRALWLISKAGGFGPPDVLCALRNLLS
ncbi:MAG TPA: four-carbon acid sugar kinase family protein [Bryobacteraceae bacterium]|nr:four-carbon acid sugar kinase family protein [Bryobacteraceae bacterium]